ncbi:MAG: DUF4880 domain-containing protein [Gammaproteobacteria bacterium]|nr:MAG: DUF4880 domain-containing protein [Gammaproteobacteria bacterium]
MSRDIEPRPLVEAAAWRTRLAEASADCSEELAVWLAEDPQNRAAWQRVQAPWALLGEQATAPELIRLRRAALAHAHDAARGRWMRGRRFALPGALATAAAILAVTTAALFIWHTQRSEVYRTSAGERRVVTLADGSRVALDSQSEVRVRYSAHARELTLTRGQARFDVFHDVERPFSVTADRHRVIATGTAFNVDLLGSSLLVTLISGPRRSRARPARRQTRGGCRVLPPALCSMPANSWCSRRARRPIFSMSMWSGRPRGRTVSSCSRMSSWPTSSRASIATARIQSS